MAKNNQKYSKIALAYLRDLDQKEPGIDHKMITWGNLQMMKDMFRLFGGDTKVMFQKTGCLGHHYRFKFVMNRLDRESQCKNAIFKKGYLHYSGIINRPTRYFKIKETKQMPKEV